jgi:TRAP transporter TAXI family solute receptor
LSPIVVRASAGGAAGGRIPYNPREVQTMPDRSGRGTARQRAPRARIIGVTMSGFLFVSACADAPPAPEPQPLRFLSGIALALAEDLVGRYTARIPDARFSFHPNRGSLVVVSALQRGDGELGFVQADVVYIAYRRGIEAEQYPHTNLRGLAVLWVNNLYIATPRRGPIHAIEDLRGRRVGVLRPGTSGEHVTRIVLGAYGMTYADIDPVFDIGRELLVRMKRGELDAAITSYPVPLDTLAELARSGWVRLIPVGREATNQLRARYPFLRRVIVPALQPRRSARSGRGGRLPADEGVLQRAAGAGRDACRGGADRPRAGADDADSAASGRGPLLSRAGDPEVIDRGAARGRARAGDPCSRG